MCVCHGLLNNLQWCGLLKGSSLTRDAEYCEKTLVEWCGLKHLIEKSLYLSVCEKDDAFKQLHGGKIRTQVFLFKP